MARIQKNPNGTLLSDAAAMKQLKKWVWGWRGPPSGARRSSQGSTTAMTTVAAGSGNLEL